MKGPRERRPAPRKFAFITRSQAVRQAAKRLERFAWPRLEMSLIVGLTGIAGFLGSVLLLVLGVEQMWLRYPLAIGIAYGAFLFQLWVWMHARHEQEPDLDSASPDDVDLSVDVGHGGGFQGGGGHFSGGGASGSWDAPADLQVDGPFDAIGNAAGESLGSVADADAGADEGCLVVFVVVGLLLLVGSLLAFAIYLVYGAPLLMAELLVDAALSFGLYRNLRRQERQFWLLTALRRTGGKFLSVALVAALMGALMASQVPGAITLGEVLQGSHREQSP